MTGLHHILQSKDTYIEPLQHLQHLLPDIQIISNAVQLLTYQRDAGLDAGQPDALLLPQTASDVVRIVRHARAHAIPIVARGAGTGLAGGAVATRGGWIIGCSRMDQVVTLDEAGRTIVVQPGIVNTTLDTAVQTRGLYYPPDPSSGRAATIGGNIGANSGGAHCFKYGVTANYVIGMEVVLADGRLVRLGGGALDYPEYDLVGLLVGSEGTLGIVTEATLRLLRNPPAVKTLMAAFDTIEAAGYAVSQVIARGLVPAALEMMDEKIIAIVEEYAHPGLPIGAGAILIAEVDGYPQSVTTQIDEIADILRTYHAFDLRVAQSAEERDKIWFGRKSAVGAMARLAPAYYLVDGTVPRSKLAQALTGVNQICSALGLRVGYVFHAGDGNLHPLILIDDPKDAACIERVHAAGRQIMELCVSQGGSITGEHGVGIEKRDYISLMYNSDELGTMQDVKAVFDPHHLFNPDKIFPLNATPTPPEQSPSQETAPTAPTASHYAPASAEEAADILRSLSFSGQSVRIRGSGSKSHLLPPAEVTLSTEALRSIHTYTPDDLSVVVGAGMPLNELQSRLAEDHLWVPWVSPWPHATVGGIVATSYNAPLRMRYGGVRDTVLATTTVLPDGRILRIGRAVVKNVAGYDLVRLFVGSHGTLGFITDVTLKLSPVPRARASLVIPINDLHRSLRFGTRLVRICLAASALVLCRGCSILTSSAPYTLIYTCEGSSQADVMAELGEVRQLLYEEGMTGVIVDEPSGSDVWRHFLAEDAPDQVMLRMGVPPRDMASVISMLAGMPHAAPLPHTAPFVADLVNGVVYARGISDIEIWRSVTHKVGGYAVVLAAPPSATAVLDVWGYKPEAMHLMQSLKQRWDSKGILNPGAFLV